MATLQASRLRAALTKAKDAGHAEESATIAGLSLVFRSLTSSQREDIIEALEDVEGAVYPLEYLQEHVCRSIVEIDGQDLRDVDTIEDEVETIDDQGNPTVEIVKFQRHEWLKKDYVSGWSSEMVSAAFRKVTDALEMATKKSTEGVEFKVEEESQEDTVRRLCSELQEAATDLPDEIREAILKEHGWLEAASPEELAALHERSKTWLQEEAQKAQDESETTQPAQPVNPAKAPQQLVEAAQKPAPDLTNRRPMNRSPIQVPIPEKSEEPVTQVANSRTPLPSPDEVHDLSAKAAQMRALEQNAAETAGLPEILSYDPNMPPQVLGSKQVLEKVEGPPDKKAAQAAMGSARPAGGINRKFVDPHKTRGLSPRGR